MSRLSIFSEPWIELVFENRNKDYGAYQLRRENPKTMAYALVIAVGLTASIFALYSLVTAKSTLSTINASKTIDEILILTKVDLQPIAKPEKAILPLSKKQTESPINKNFKKPTIVESTQAVALVAQNSEIKNNTLPNPSATGSGESKILSNSDFGESSSETLAPNHGNTTFNANELDKNPEFPGGLKNFLSYVATNFKVGEEVENTLKVTVSFVVEKDGAMSNITVRNNPGYGVGEEAIRVLKSMKTKWVAGIKDGQKVRAFYSLPITIQL